MELHPTSTISDGNDFFTLLTKYDIIYPPLCYRILNFGAARYLEASENSGDRAGGEVMKYQKPGFSERYWTAQLFGGGCTIFLYIVVVILSVTPPMASVNLRFMGMFAAVSAVGALLFAFGLGNVRGATVYSKLYFDQARQDHFPANDVIVCQWFRRLLKQGISEGFSFEIKDLTEQLFDKKGLKCSGRAIGAGELVELIRHAADRITFDVLDSEGNVLHFEQYHLIHILRFQDGAATLKPEIWSHLLRIGAKSLDVVLHRPIERVVAPILVPEQETENGN